MYDAPAVAAAAVVVACELVSAVQSTHVPARQAWCFIQVMMINVPTSLEAHLLIDVWTGAR